MLQPPTLAQFLFSRYFVRGIRESCYMILSLAATYCGSAFWTDSQLASSLVPSVTADLQHLDYQQLRMLHRHVYHAWAAHCPSQVLGMWVLPVIGVVLPVMTCRLAAGWAATMSVESELAGSTSRQATGPQQQQQQQDTDTSSSRVANEVRGLPIHLSDGSCFGNPIEVPCI
jgi:hypothetical protein